MNCFSRLMQRTMCAIISLAMLLAFASSSRGQGAPISDESFTFKIYATNYAFYPFVSAYIRTFDANHEPLTNLNWSNVALMVKGRAYDKSKLDQLGSPKTYRIETLQNRGESFRTVFVWDCSKTMEGQPFIDARNAIMKFIEAKRPGDEIAIIAIRDTKEGCQLVSNFEKNTTLLFQRIEDVKCDGQKTRLYDSIFHAVELCSTSSQGDTSAQGAEYIVLNTIVVLSDGKDEGSAMDRGELVSQLSRMKVPIPIMSLAYSKVDTAYFKNLETLSKATFGRYWVVGETQQFAQTIQKIHQINRQDYVVTFRVYGIEVDGEKHNYKVGLTYPSNSGKMKMDAAEFEAIDSSPMLLTPRGKEIMAKLEMMFPLLAEGPYMGGPAVVPAAGRGPVAAPAIPAAGSAQAPAAR